MPPDKHQRGLVLHGLGWPLDNDTGGGLVHVSLGREFLLGRLCRASQLHQPVPVAVRRIPARQDPSARSRAFLEGGKRIGYGARAITEGGFQSVPKLVVPGGALIGCGAGFVNVPRIKGSHNAMKTGMLAAEAAFAAARRPVARATCSMPMKPPIARATSTKT